MAAAAVAVPSYNRVEPGSSQLQSASYPVEDATPKADADEIATEWIDVFNKVLNGAYDDVESLFLPGSSWRDQLGLSWNYHTLNGPERIQSFLKQSTRGSRIKSVAIDRSNDTRKPEIAPVDYYGKVNGIITFLTLDTDVGRGRGLVRLLQDPEASGKWKAFTLFTSMQELKGHEESTFGNRPHGVEHGCQPGRKNWQERRIAQENYEGDLEPTVLIIGVLDPLGWVISAYSSSKVLVKAVLPLLLVCSSSEFRRSLSIKMNAWVTIGGRGVLICSIRAHE